MPISSQLVALATLSRKEIHRFMRIWQQTLIPPVITTSLYFLIFGSLIGKRIGKMDGFDYMDFIVPGLILMSVIQSSYANVASSFFSAKFQRSLEELLVSPMPNYIIMGGYVIGGMTRGILVGAVVTFVSAIFTGFSATNILVLIAVVILNAFRYGFLGISDINVGFSFFLIIAFIVLLSGLALSLLDRGYGIRH